MVLPDTYTLRWNSQQYQVIMDNMFVEKAAIENAEEILNLQKIAYISEAEIIDDFTIPPLHQTYGEILSEFSRQIFLKVVKDNKIIGSVRASDH